MPGQRPKQRLDTEDKLVGCGVIVALFFILAWMGFLAWVIYELVEHFAH